MPELPHIPAQDFFFGLASAGVLLWTLMYLSRSQIFGETPEQSEDDDIFYHLSQKQPFDTMVFTYKAFFQSDIYQSFINKKSEKNGTIL